MLLIDMNRHDLNDLILIKDDDSIISMKNTLL